MKKIYILVFFCLLVISCEKETDVSSSIAESVPIEEVEVAPLAEEDKAGSASIMESTFIEKVVVEPVKKEEKVFETPFVFDEYFQDEVTPEKVFTAEYEDLNGDWISYQFFGKVTETEEELPSDGYPDLQCSWGYARLIPFSSIVIDLGKNFYFDTHNGIYLIKDLQKPKPNIITFKIYRSFPVPEQRDAMGELIPAEKEITFYFYNEDVVAISAPFQEWETVSYGEDSLWHRHSGIERYTIKDDSMKRIEPLPLEEDEVSKIEAEVEPEPEPELQIGVINDTRVSLRSEPNLESETLEFLNTGDKVSIIDKSVETQKIDDMEDYWYKVQVGYLSGEYPDGWVYGAFIDIW